MSRNARTRFVKNYRFKYHPKILEAFEQGKLILGFDRRLVKYMYGKPDRKSIDDKVWFYCYKNGSIAYKLTFQDDILIEIFYPME